MAMANAFYDQLAPHVLSDTQLRNNEYPMWLVDGQQVGVHQNCHNSVNRPIAQDGDPLRICQRCALPFDITRNARTVCVHHPQRAWLKPGQKVRRYLCCHGGPGRKGCTMLRYHVTHQFTAASLFQYVQAPAAAADDARSNSVYALDAEFVYTSSGSEIARLTLVDVDGIVKLDALIRLAKPVTDYNTIHSGLNKSKLDKAPYTLDTAREALFQFVNRETILIGHSLENDLKALRFVHTKVVDTAVAFPHAKKDRKYSLKELALTHFGLNIQQGTQHCSAEDAQACMKLMRQMLASTTGTAALLNRLRI